MIYSQQNQVACNPCVRHGRPRRLSISRIVHLSSRMSISCRCRHKPTGQTGDSAHRNRTNGILLTSTTLKRQGRCPHKSSICSTASIAIRTCSSITGRWPNAFKTAQAQHRAIAAYTNAIISVNPAVTTDDRNML